MTPNAQLFIVMRTDDNGNDVEVARLPTRAEADALAGEYEARAHKQMYWVADASRVRRTSPA